MELGKRLRQARLEAGLSQRQLCGDIITRNMLSQIENGTARPSMDTLRRLAQRLGKPVSFFLDDQAVTSPNQTVMDAARAAHDRGHFALVLDALTAYAPPDPIFDREKALLEAVACLHLAEDAAAQDRDLYALDLLARAGAIDCPYLPEELERRRLLLTAKARRRDLKALCGLLPVLDDELLLRAEAALESGELRRCAALLAACENRDAPGWNLLRGRAFMSQKDYAPAAECLLRAEDTHPEAWALLETCFRELEDYKQAYYYACKQKKA